MYTLNLQVSPARTAFTSGMIKMLEFFKFPQQTKLRRSKPDKSSTAHLLHLIEKGQTILKIGTQEASTLYFLSQKVGEKGRVIAFERHTGILTYLNEVKQLLKWNNVTIEHTNVAGKTGQPKVTLGKNDKPSSGATVISFDVQPKKATEKENVTATLDMYCSANGIYPDIIKIDAEGEEFLMLLGAIDVLKTQKPKILVSCEERKAGREKIISMFRFLVALGYKGYFTLDTMLLPLENFDFNVYQNPYADFYCSNFIFS